MTSPFRFRPVALAAMIALGSCSAHNASSPVPNAVVNPSQAGFARHALPFKSTSAIALDKLMPRGVSPNSVPTGAMHFALNSAMPESAVSKGRIRPLALQAALTFSVFPGAASQIVVSPSDNSVFALGTGTGDRAIYRNRAGSWTQIPGAASRIAISPNGATLYAINSSGGIFANNLATGVWTGLAGGASDISVMPDGSVIVLGNTGGDGAGNYPIYRYVNGSFVQVPGAGGRIYGAVDPNTYQVNAGPLISPGGFYVLNAATSAIYYYDPGVGFVQIPGAASSLAPANGGFFVIGGGALYFYDYTNPGWTAEPGSGASIAVGKTAIYVVVAGGTIYSSPLWLQTPFNTSLYPVLTTGTTQFFGITRGPDNAMWFVDRALNMVGRITTSGVVTEYASGAGPSNIVSGPDGNLWITETTANKIGQITPGGVLTEYVVPTATSTPLGITSGSDGALWFTETNANKIGRITTSGSFTEYAVPTATSDPRGITAGPDGALWFVESAANKIGRVTTGGTFTEYAITTPSSGSFYIVAGPDGNLWFTETNTAKIGRMTTGGTVSEYPLPSSNVPYGITNGPDGALWFSEATANGFVGRITTAGVITEYNAYNLNESAGIATGPDGSLWFTLFFTPTIGRFTPTH